MSTSFPPVPLTLEGSPALHQFFSFDWKSWHATSASDRASITAEFVATLKSIEVEAAKSHLSSGPSSPDATGSSDSPSTHIQTGLFSQLGHKGDLLLVHFRPTFEALNQVELTLAQTRLYGYLTLRHSYVSVVELGLYESTRKTFEAAAAKGFVPHTPEWNADVEASLLRAKSAMSSRLYPSIPEAKFLCFYPMDRKRDETKNWYTIPFADRQRMMHDHGLIGRRYGDVVKQIITGSIGMDDWEWGVTLFAEDPIVFKKLIYEMRFDEVSAEYALFGQFFLAIKLPIDNLPGWLSGKL